MNDHKIIDAEFEVVSEPRPVPRAWNGTGLPPEWPTWGILPKLTYIVLFGAGMWGVWSAAHWIADLIVPR